MDKSNLKAVIHLKAAIKAFQVPAGTEIPQQFVQLDAALIPLSYEEVFAVVKEVVGDTETITIRDAVAVQEPLLRDIILDRKRML